MSNLSNPMTQQLTQYQYPQPHHHPQQPQPTQQQPQAQQPQAQQPQPPTSSHSRNSSASIMCATPAQAQQHQHHHQHHHITLAHHQTSQMNTGGAYVTAATGFSNPPGGYPGVPRLHHCNAHSFLCSNPALHQYQVSGGCLGHPPNYVTPFVATGHGGPLISHSASTQLLPPTTSHPQLYTQPTVSLGQPTVQQQIGPPGPPPQTPQSGPTHALSHPQITPHATHPHATHPHPTHPHPTHPHPTHPHPTHPHPTHPHPTHPHPTHPHPTHPHPTHPHPTHPHPTHPHQTHPHHHHHQQPTIVSPFPSHTHLHQIPPPPHVPTSAGGPRSSGIEVLSRGLYRNATQGHVIGRVRRGGALPGIGANRRGANTWRGGSIPPPVPPPTLPPPPPLPTTAAAAAAYPGILLHFLAMLSHPSLHQYNSVEQVVAPEAPDTENYEALLHLAERLGEAKPRGLIKTVIDQLPSYRYTGETCDTKQTTCVICMCDFELRQMLRVLPCLHEFHTKCIDKWLKSNRTCPICRGDASEYLKESAME